MVAISIAVNATLRSGTGSRPIPTLRLIGPAQYGGRGRETALQEAVLPEPELVEAALVGRPRDIAQGLGTPLGQEDRSE